MKRKLRRSSILTILVLSILTVTGAQASQGAPAELASPLLHLIIIPSPLAIPVFFVLEPPITSGGFDPLEVGSESHRRGWDLDDDEVGNRDVPDLTWSKLKRLFA